MSYFEHIENQYKILMGYDRILNYTFMQIFDENEMIIYNNLDEVNPFNILNLDIFINKAKAFEILIPNEIIYKIEIEILKYNPFYQMKSNPEVMILTHF